MELRDCDISADISHENTRHRGFIVTRTQAVVFIIIVIALVVLTGLLLAMFGPGNKELKYHTSIPRGDSSCKGEKAAFPATECDKSAASSPELMECDVAIVGGGIAGLYMAETLLRLKRENSVCVFEKESRFGGRIFDYWFPQVPNVTVGLGAWRVDIDFMNMMNLLQRSNISLGNWNYHHSTILESRGVFTNNSMDIKTKAFPTLDSGKFRNMTSNEMASFAFRDDHVATASHFASVDSYMSHYLTPEGAEFLSELYGYKGDYTEAINPAAYIEYLNLLFVLSDKYQRPFNGMSAFVDWLVTSVRLHGGKLYRGNRVSFIDRKENRFALNTCYFNIFAKKVVIATHPAAFMKIKGSVAKQIQRHPVFLSIQIMPAFKGAAVYKEAWWEKSVEGRHFTLSPRQRFISNSNCMGLTMPYGEVKRALEYKFGSPVPDPLDTVYQYWDEGAWHFQKPGSNISLSQVNNWAKRPVPGQDIFVIGDAYNPYRGWTEGAILSAQNALLEGWKIPKPSSTKEGKKLKSFKLSELVLDSSKALQRH